MLKPVAPVVSDESHVNLLVANSGVQFILSGSGSFAMGFPAQRRLCLRSHGMHRNAARLPHTGVHVCVCDID